MDTTRNLRIPHVVGPWIYVIVYKSSAVAEMGDRRHNRHGPKRVGCCAVPLSRNSGNPSNTMWPAPMSTSVPSGVFIHQCRMPLAA